MRAGELRSEVQQVHPSNALSPRTLEHAAAVLQFLVEHAQLLKASAPYGREGAVAAPVRQNMSTCTLDQGCIYCCDACRYEEQLLVTSSITLAAAQQVRMSWRPVCDTTCARHTLLRSEHVPSLLPSDVA
jgi:hypothetical protein